MVLESDVKRADQLMSTFLQRTGVTSTEPAKRYLWTDAFAVCNLLTLAREKPDRNEARLASQLVEQVHHTLGRFRSSDVRKGWLSGLSDSQGELHPTQGGLRIGKPLPERAPDEPYDDALEWERDGQYFHYLTQWMLALNRMASFTHDAKPNTWARELAKTAQRGFSYQSRAGRTRMYWKMSVDLSRPLVASMGHDDPLDGYVTYLELMQTAKELDRAPKEPNLDQAIASFWSIVEHQDLASDDPLSLGELLLVAKRADDLVKLGAPVHPGLFERLIDAARRGLSLYLDEQPFEQPAARRLAFRELGLAIGLEALGRLGSDPRISSLAPHFPVARRITRFWLDEAHHAATTWTDHQDINEVMLASALLGSGC